MRIELEIHPVGSHRWYVRHIDFVTLHVEITQLTILEGYWSRSPFHQSYSVKTVGWTGHDYMDPQIGLSDKDIPFEWLYETKEEADAAGAARLAEFRGSWNPKADQPE